MANTYGCGGCLGLGAHTRWCPVVVGKLAASLGLMSETVEEWGDLMGSLDPDTGNLLYKMSQVLESRAHTARQQYQEQQQAMDELARLSDEMGLYDREEQ